MTSSASPRSIGLGRHGGTSITSFPDRILWGTDIDSWRYDAEVHRRYIEFSRAFIAGLPASVQRGHAYGNAERVMGTPAR